MPTADAQRAERGDVPAGRQHGAASTATRPSTACRNRSSTSRSTASATTTTSTSRPTAFFASVTPRQDAVEAVTVTTAVGGADVGGHGAVGINFVTRSGTNRFTGSAYEYYRDPELNSNYWFNKRNGLPKNDVKLNQYGVRAGRADRDSRAVRRPQQGVLLRQLRAAAASRTTSRAPARCCIRARSEGWFRYNVRRRQVARSQRARPRRARTASSRRSIPRSCGMLGNINAVDADDGHAEPARAIRCSTTTSGRARATSSSISRSIRLDYNLSDKPSADRAPPTRSGSTRDPDHLNNGDGGSPARRTTASSCRPGRSRRSRCARRCRRTWSTSCAAASRAGGASYFGAGRRATASATFADSGRLRDRLRRDDIGLTNWHTTNGPSWRSALTATASTRR